MASVIVPFRNPGPYFRPMLASLAVQQLHDRWEVILVDNGSTDHSAEVAESFADRMPLRIIKADKLANASYARNIGIREAVGEFVLFVDSDDEIAPGYLQAMIHGARQHGFVTSRADSTTLNPDWCKDAHGPQWQADSVPIGFHFMPVAGPNVAMPRDVLLAVGGYSEDFTGSQDIEVAWRVQQHTGKPLQFVPDAVYRYRHRDTLRGLFRQTYNWGYSNVLLYAKFRAAGMPGRSIKEAISDWCSSLAAFLRVRSKKDLAAALVDVGYCVGRLRGSIRYRVLYL